MDRLPISVVILAFNEEKNIAGCLKSVEGWVEDIFIVDSFSTDKTLEIARRYTQNIYQHSFENYGQQRNWALENLPLKTDWILNLDADQRVTAPLKEELFKIFSQGKLNDANGFMIKTKTVFMGKWIRWGGHYPIYRIYLFRKGKGNYETRRYHQHCLVEGKIIRLKRDIVDVICPDLTTMIERLNKWSTEEAKEFLEANKINQVKAHIFGSPIERKRWLRTQVYWRLPLFLRSFLYFFYRYFLRLGFLDGRQGLTFHFLQGFLMYFLTDVKIYEYRKIKKYKEEKNDETGRFK